MTQIRDFGTTQDGRKVQAVTIESSDLTATLLTFGACLNDLRLVGVAHPLTPGSPDLAAYEGPLAYHGTLIGPVANRITGASVVVNGSEFQLARHDGQNFTLHSGPKGTQYKVWEVVEHGLNYVKFGLTLPDCCDGFPGNRSVIAHYEVVGNSLTLMITATTDENTVFNFANHSFWTLDDAPNYTGQRLQIHADHITQVDDMLCPTGELTLVGQAGLDFRGGRYLAGTDVEFIDHNFCTAESQQPLRDVADLTGNNGIRMTIATTEPGLQVYDCGTIDAAGFATHHGMDYPLYHGLALEAQNWPDATTYSHFPDIMTTADRPYAQVTKWTFDKV